MLGPLRPQKCNGAGTPPAPRTARKGSRRRARLRHTESLRRRSKSRRRSGTVGDHRRPVRSPAAYDDLRPATDAPPRHGGRSPGGQGIEQGRNRDMLRRDDEVDRRYRPVAPSICRRSWRREHVVRCGNRASSDRRGDGSAYVEGEVKTTRRPHSGRLRQRIQVSRALPSRTCRSALYGAEKGEIGGEVVTQTVRSGAESRRRPRTASADRGRDADTEPVDWARSGARSRGWLKGRPEPAADPIDFSRPVNRRGNVQDAWRQNVRPGQR